MLELIRDFWTFLLTRKKLVLLPLFFVLILMGLLLVVSQGSAVAPFIYSLF